jgi:Cu/Ag efflux protein CusF
MKKMILLVTLLTLVAFVSGAMAQQKPAPAPAPAPAAPAKKEEPKIEKFTGVVEKVDEMAKAVVVKDKKVEKTFAVDDKTKITKGGKDMPLAELKKGMNVSVEYKKDGEKLVAVAIKASAPKAAPKK